MKKENSIFFTCILTPLLAAVIGVALIAILHQPLMRANVFRLFKAPGWLVKNAMTYFRIVDFIAFLLSMLFCMKEALKEKGKKAITALIAAVIGSLIYAFVGVLIFKMTTGNPMMIDFWSLLLNFIVIAAILIIFNMFFTKAFAESAEMYREMEKLRKEKEAELNFAMFMSNPHAAIAPKKSGTKEILKGAAVGAVVAGPAGAVVGAVVGKNKADQKANAAPVSPAMQAVSYKKDDGTKTIIKDAVIGGIVAGPTGAVVGAMVGKNEVDNKK